MDFRKIRTYLVPVDWAISKRVIHLAVPVITSNLSRTFMGLVDVAMVGRLGAAALAATGLSNMIVWAARGLSGSFQTATQTVAARRWGEKRYPEVGSALRNGLFLGAIYSLPVALAGYFFARRFIPFFVDDPETTQLCIDYTTIISATIFTTTLSFVFQGFYTGIERTKIQMYATVASNLINVYLNIGLIYGFQPVAAFFGSSDSIFHVFGNLWWWAPQEGLGVKGAALGTLIASIWQLGHYILALFGPSIRRQFHIFRARLHWATMKRQLLLAWPQGIHETMVNIAFAFYFKIVGMIGVSDLAAIQVVFSIMSVSFMPAIGVGQACSTVVGKALGEKKKGEAAVGMLEGVRWAVWIMGTVGLLFMIFPQFIVPIFSVDPQVISRGIIGLRILGGVEFVDAIGMTLWFALTGAGNTAFPAVVDISLSYGLLLPAAYFTGITLNWGFIGVGATLALYLVLFAAIMVWKVSKGDWQYIEV